MGHLQQELDDRFLKLFGKRVAFLALLLGLSFMLVISMGSVQALAASTQCTRTYDGDLVVDGNQVLEITGETLCVHGNITVKDNAKLVLTDVTLRMDRFTDDFCDNWTRFDVFDSASAQINNVVFDLPGGAVWLASYDQAVVCLDNVTSYGESSGLHLTADGDSEMHVVSSNVFEAGISGSANMAIQDTQIVWAVRMGFYGQEKLVLSDIVPGWFDTWDFPTEECVTTFHLSLQNTSVGAWSIIIGEGADLKITDSTIDHLVLYLNTVTGSLHEIGPGFFTSWSLHGDNRVECATRVQLENTTVKNALDLVLSGRVEVNIEDSTLSTLLFEDGYLDFALENTEVELLQAHDVLGEITSVDSSVTGGVEFDNATLTVEGSLSFSPDCYIVDWQNSTIIRDFPVLVEEDFDTPASQMPVEISLPDGRHLNQTTDDNGRTSFQYTFTDATYQDTCQLQVAAGSKKITRSVGFLSSSPVNVRLNECPGTKSLIPYDGLVISLPGTYEFKAGEFHLEDSNQDGHIILINSDDVTLIGHDTALIGGEDYTFDTPYYVVAIQMHDRHNITIEGFTIMNYAIGIQSTGYQSHITIRNNNFLDNSGRGVEIVDREYLPFPPQRDHARSSNILIENNYVVGNTNILTRLVEGKTLPCRYKQSEEEGDAANCTGIFGLYWYAVENSVMRGNTVKNTTLSGLRPDYMQDCVIEDNVVDFSHLAIWTCSSGLLFRNGNIYRNNEVTNSLMGLGIGENGRDNLYENNDLHDNLYGMYLLGQVDVSKQCLGNQGERIINNKMYNNVFAGLGMYLDRLLSSKNLNTYIQGNMIFDNGGFGIDVEGSGHIAISNNEIYGNGQDGVLVRDESVATIEENSIHNNLGWGVAVWVRACHPDEEDIPDGFGGEVSLDGNKIEDNGKGPVCGI
jgi:parallel beta-helix repeat protein